MPDGTAARRLATIRRSAIVAEGLVLALVVLADYFFYRHPIGWTVGGYGHLVLIVVLARSSSPLRARSAQVITAAATSSQKARRGTSVGGVSSATGAGSPRVSQRREVSSGTEADERAPPIPG